MIDQNQFIVHSVGGQVCTLRKLLAGWTKFQTDRRLSENAWTALRVGKIGRGGVDYPKAKSDLLIRCHILHVALRQAEPDNATPAPARKDLPEIDVHYAIYDAYLD